MLSPGVKIIDELGERLGFQILFFFHERETGPAYYENVPFSRVSAATIEKSRALVSATKLPGMLGLMTSVVGQGTLEADRYALRSDGAVARKTNAAVDTAIVSVSSCLPKGNVNVMGDEVARLAFKAVEHYAKIPIVRYFLAARGESG